MRETTQRERGVVTPDDVARLAMEAGRIVRPLAVVLDAIEHHNHAPDSREGVAALADAAEDAARASAKAYRALRGLGEDAGGPHVAEGELLDLEADVAAAAAVAAMLVGAVEGDAGGAYVPGDIVLDVGDYYGALIVLATRLGDWYSEERVQQWADTQEAKVGQEEVAHG